MSRALGGLLILTENHTLVPPGDLDGLVKMARAAERAGMNAVMLGDHVCLGPSAGALGRPENPRSYAAPGKQDPATEWPSPIVMAAAIAASTSRIRIVLAALITPLRNPVVLAKDLATLDRLSAGRLVVQPTVSWARDEYQAVGVAFESRGRILDDGLAAMKVLWRGAPASYEGEYFSFDAVYSKPSPVDPGGPALWFGGQSVHPPLLRRLVAHGSGFHPFGSPSRADLEALEAGLRCAGRSPDDLEMIGGTRATFDGPEDIADLDESMASFDEQVAQGYTTFCMKPSQHTDDVADVESLCERMVGRLSLLGGT
ncbi:MAG TPA: TIGR03619 family F420-dependent LLM class oxidoreductase [Candidatus Poseidoniales archaeon]|jgi:probable F420-dependent oxidoreductase|nr:TIGR03619 family F420-dependent LLM class oxidoreductase [Candidatus Poseidoniales archaeon]HIL48184.1 TIGR03619 family F420-dependent LLM class oxidoreductase [Acidimicrobiia bacterium]